MYIEYLICILMYCPVYVTCPYIDVYTAYLCFEVYIVHLDVNKCMIVVY